MAKKKSTKDKVWDKARADVASCAVACWLSIPHECRRLAWSTGHRVQGRVRRSLLRWRFLARLAVSGVEGQALPRMGGEDCQDPRARRS